MKTEIKKVRVNFIEKHKTEIMLLRWYIIAYVLRDKYFVPYGHLANEFKWSQPQLWQYLDAMGDEDVLEGRPRADAFVGRYEPSNGHHNEKVFSEAHSSRWSRIVYLNNEIVRLCNYYRLQFRQRIIFPSGGEKFFLRTSGMWYKNAMTLRPPVKRIVEKQKRLFKKKATVNSVK